MNPLSETQWSAAYRYERIFLKSHTPFTTSGSPSTATITIPHNLGYEPFYRTFFLFSGDSNYYQGFNGTSSVALGNWVINNINATTANLDISVTNLGGASSGIVYYRIYEEPQAA